MNTLGIPEGEEAKDEPEERLTSFVEQFKALANEGKIVFNIDELKQKIVDETLAEATKKFEAEKEDMQVFLQQKITRNLELEMENDELKNKNRQLESSASSGGAGAGMMKNALIGFMKNKGKLLKVDVIWT